MSTAEREDGHKSSSLAVSGNKQLQPAAGDGFDLPVILLEPGEKFSRVKCPALSSLTTCVTVYVRSRPDRQ